MGLCSAPKAGGVVKSRLLTASLAIAASLLRPAPLWAEDETPPVELSPGGAAILLDAGEQPEPSYAYLGQFVVTAYACPPFCGRTASGLQVGPGSIAADWRMIPPGTQLVLPGYRGEVMDRGGALRGNRLDIWLPYAEAIFWGRQVVPVWMIVEPVED